MSTISVHKTFADVAALKGEWDHLVRETSATNVFLSHTWCATWSAAFARDGALRVLCLRDGDRLVAIAPLVQTRSFGSRVLRWIGHGDSDYLGLLAAPGDLARAAEAMLGWLMEHRGEWDILECRDIEPGLLECLGAVCPPALRQISRMSESCPYITIDATWEEFTARRKERFRRLRQTVNKAQRSAKIEFRYAEDIGLSVEQIEREVSAIEADSWKAAEGRTLFRPDQRHFWQELLPKMLPPREITICFMDLDGVPAAYSLGFRFGNKIYGRSTAFRNQFRAISPGTVMMERIIRDAFAAGCREFDFTRGDEGYKGLWTTEARNSFECVTYQPDMRTRLVVDLLYRRRWALRGNPYARRLRTAYRVTRERCRRWLARSNSETG